LSAPCSLPIDCRGVRGARGRYARLSDQERETVAALLSVGTPHREIERRTQIHRNTVKRLQEELQFTGELQRRREECQREFVDEAWSCMLLALQAIKKGLVESLDGYGRHVRPTEAAGVIATLARAVQRIEDAQPGLVEQLAGFTEEELRAEIARTEEELAVQKALSW